MYNDPDKMDYVRENAYLGLLPHVRFSQANFFLSRNQTDIRINIDNDGFPDILDYNR